MPRESTTVQCYPSDSAVNSMVQRYEAFGWELVSNQKFQEYTGQSIDGTKNYSTYNKLTFSRDKDASWYRSVAALELKHNGKLDEKERLLALQPSEPQFSSLAMIFCGLISIWTLFIPIIAYSVRKSKKKKKYREDMDKWHRDYDSVISELNGEISALRAEAQNVICG